MGRMKVGDEDLRLFSEHSAQGVQASVFNSTEELDCTL